MASFRSLVFAQAMMYCLSYIEYHIQRYHNIPNIVIYHHTKRAANHTNGSEVIDMSILDICFQCNSIWFVLQCLWPTRHVLEMSQILDAMMHYLSFIESYIYWCHNIPIITIYHHTKRAANCTSGLEVIDMSRFQISTSDKVDM